MTFTRNDPGLAHVCMCIYIVTVGRVFLMHGNKMLSP